MSVSKTFWQYIGKKIANSFDDEPSTPDPTPSNADDNGNGNNSDNSGGDGFEPIDNQAPQMATPDIARELLSAIGCQCDWHDESDDVASCDIVYQGGHFLLRTWHRHPYCLISFPYFYSASIDELDIVRSVANRCNMESILTRVVISEDEAHAEVHCHVMAHIALHEVSPAAKQTFNDIMIACFGVRRDFEHHIDEARADGFDDPEQESYNRRRDAFLISEQAWAHDKLHIRATPSDPAPLTLTALLQRIYEWDDIANISLQAIVDGQLIAIPEAADYDLFTLLPTPTSDTPQQPLSLFIAVERNSLSFANEEIGASVDAHEYVTGTMRLTHHDATSIYAQVTLSRQPSKPGDLRIATHPAAKPDSTTFIVARDLTTDADRRAEYDYMLADAHDKSEGGHEAELSDTQRYLLVTEPLVGDSFNLYWGHYYVRRQRYLEALPHFENIYGRLCVDVPRLKRPQRDLLYNTMYNIGLCHARLGHPQQAFYYLDAAAHSDNTDHIIELINLLVNHCDPRADMVLNNVMNNVQDQLANADDADEQTPEAMQHFISFLNMRRAYYYIEMRRWHEAEGILRHLMRDNSTREFARRELDYIKSIRNNK